MNGDTRLSVALQANPAILEYIVSLNTHDFARLRNPVMRKVMPPRITLRRIAAMLGIPEDDFVANINELAGTPGQTTPSQTTLTPLPVSPSERPDWLSNVDVEHIEWVDVTPLDKDLADPMPPINVAVNKTKPGQVVGIMHMWEPQPLYDIWHSRGFQFWSQKIDEDLWHIFVYRPEEN